MGDEKTVGVDLCSNSITDQTISLNTDEIRLLHRWLSLGECQKKAVIFDLFVQSELDILNRRTEQLLKEPKRWECDKHLDMFFEEVKKYK